MGSLELITFSADLTVHSSILLSCLVADTNQKVMEVQRTDCSMDRQLLGRVKLPELVQEVHPMLGLFDVGISL